MPDARYSLPPRRRSPFFFVAPDFVDSLARAGIEQCEQLFSDPRIHAWRDIRERQNCTLDVQQPDGSIQRLHVKRDNIVVHSESVADEAWGLSLMESHGIATAPLVAAGRLDDGRGVLVTRDLAGYLAADRLLQAGKSFDDLLAPTATTAAAFHSAGLHHRDLYLNHFYIALHAPATPPVRLIDAVRVRPIPWLFPWRWLIKDIGQFIFSTFEHAITDAQRNAWFDAYAERCTFNAEPLRLSSLHKAKWIARHDAALRKRHPTRNLPMPDALLARGKNGR